MKSFLDSVIPGIRCQNPNCRAVPPVNNPITVQMLLYDGWMCRSCGEEYRGALADPDLIPILVHPDAIRADVKGFSAELREQLVKGEDVPHPDFKILSATPETKGADEASLKAEAVVERKPEKPRVLEDLKRPELVAELERFDLKLDDVPVTRGAVSNADIRAYLVSKVTATA